MTRTRPRLTLPCLALFSLTACGTAANSNLAVVVVPPSRIVNPCDAIRLPARLDDARRKRLADEIAAAAPDAVWPDVLRDAAAIEAALRACQAAR